jgi:hypothetical protein
MKIFGLKKGEVHNLGYHNEKLHDLYTSWLIVSLEQ